MLTTTSSIQLVWLGGREKLSPIALFRFSTVAPTKRREEMRREGGWGRRGSGMEVAAIASSASAADAADAEAEVEAGAEAEAEGEAD